MAAEHVNTLIVGGGQAGLAMSAHLSKRGIGHLVLERDRIAETWRSARRTSLVANGPAWHDRFPAKEFADTGPDDFASAQSVVTYFEEFARETGAPVRCGTEVQSVRRAAQGMGFRAETSQGPVTADHVVAATGPFQLPAIPPVIPQTAGLLQIHSSDYRDPGGVPEGAVLVVGAGSSGAQIAEELSLAGRRVYLSVGPHDRPPRRYRGKDFVWWLGCLGKWQMKTPPAGSEHVTIAVSGARGGRTVDFRRFAHAGITLLGMTQGCRDGVVQIAPDLAGNIARGDADYLALLDEADAYVAAGGADLPPDPDARVLPADPECLTRPLARLDLAQAGISTVIWATGYEQDFGWLQVDAFDAEGRPSHSRGVSTEPGVYFLGLPWLSMRGSSFIWGVWEDADYLSAHIAGGTSGEARRLPVAYPEG
ncbi:flavin-containing monooxygenase [Roseobacter ponti]|uniref:NAD(P)-binding domain-containing protein n=1 Tax=Roseobacter ponti TaxID=1891787 RepID=A0A858SW87_9RHOB|nr:NAD(P)/FAD-dependent oxidoreductase [Roseobacter ponti]QJF51913.1 NAD(P)-binding domain-containing protein [Roseobacter ponti]